MSAELKQVSYTLDPSGQYEPTAEESLVGITAPQISESAYKDRLAEINDSFRIARGSRAVELAVVNQDSLGKDAVLFPSTSFSSLSQNPGNAIELAARGAANPNVAYIYAAYPGNGGSQSLSVGERLYLARTGRFTEGQGWINDPYEAIFGVEAITFALEKAGIVPNYLSGDESGGRLGLGLMTALDRNTVKDAYFNGIPGISQRASYTTQMLAEDAASRVRRRGITDSLPGEITPDRRDQAKKLMPKIYSGLSNNRVLSTYLRAPANVLANMRAFGGHNDLSSPATHAALQDTLAALTHHEAVISFQFNQASRLHDREDCIAFGRQVMNLIPENLRSEHREVKIIFGEGGLDQHTDEPTERLRSERNALGSISRFMIALSGGALKSRPQVPATEKAA